MNLRIGLRLPPFGRFALASVSAVTAFAAIFAALPTASAAEEGGNPVPVAASNSPCGLALCALTADEQALIDRQGLQLISVPSDGIERTMAIGTAAKGIPETVQGIWWITVNPLDYLLDSFGGDTTWDPFTHTAHQNLYGSLSASFHHTNGGKNLFLNFLRIHAGFNFRFSDDGKFATIHQTFDLLGQTIEMPEAILKYQMRWVEDGHFVRESWLFGQRLPDYQLRRIVKADGTRDADYGAYLLNADPESLLAVPK